ncbi:MAG TPA: alpha/beta hydrolase [Ktedonobacteraceae bacterium]|nr:alpha/beta hydrolase [Ktedonobacteraceae bacterium]
MSTQIEDGFITANGLRIHYRRWTSSAYNPELPPILLLHGLASSAHIWNLVAPLLNTYGYTVTALDQRGHGESDKPASGYDFDSILTDDTAAIDALKIEHPILVGHSWGAMVALQFAAQQVDQVKAVVLVDGATNQLSSRPGWSREQAMKDLAPPRFAGTSREDFLAYYRSSPLGERWSSALEDSVLNIVRLRDDDTVAPRLDFENHLQIIGAMWDQPTFELYREVQCPVTLIIADQEPANEAMKEFSAMRKQGIAHILDVRPDARIVMMQNTMHDIPLQRPEELAELIVKEGAKP